jgi:hypothetical protein
MHVWQQALCSQLNLKQGKSAIITAIKTTYRIFLERKMVENDAKFCPLSIFNENVGNYYPGLLHNSINKILMLIQNKQTLWKS